MTTTIENKIAKSIEEQKLPALTGSVKQIAWATDIRAKKLARLDDRVAKIQSNVSDDAQRRKNEIVYQAARNVLLTKVESRFWIDNRFVDGTKLLAANNLQGEFNAEFERLCNEVKAEVKAETEAANVATGYVFSKFFAFADGEVINTYCKIIGDENNFDNSVYRAVVLYNPEGFAGWELKTADGKLLAKGNSKNDAYKFLATETDGSEDDTDEQNDVFNLLPAIETLNDVDTNFTAELTKLQAAANDAYATFIKAQDAHEQATDALKNCLNNTAFKLKQKLDALPLDYTITLKKTSGATYHFPDFSEIYIGAYHIGCDAEFHFENWRGRTIARYNTPAQVESVIHMLKAAIERGDEEFTFPTVDELNTPPEMPPCTPKSPDITQANNEHKPEKSVSEPPFWAESRMSEWLEYKYRPILPYVIDIDSAEIVTGKVWINKRSHTVEEC